MSSTPPPNFKNRATPGVYITELDAFPTSIVGVQTAIPAFIGYTEQASNNGQSVLLKPVAITSLNDYLQIFGGAYNGLFDLVPVPSTTTPDVVAGQQNYVIAPATGQTQFNLYNSLRLFYANGGGTCYVVSVGTYKGTQTIKLTDLEAGLNAISTQAGPTMLVVPDAVLLPASGTTANDVTGSNVPTSTDFTTLTQQMLRQAATHEDRVAIFDLYGTQAVTKTNLDANLEACVSAFQSSVIAANVLDPSYGAAYFPFVNTSIVQTSEVNYTNFNPKQLPTSSIALTQLKAILTALNQAQYAGDIPKQTQVQETIDTIDQSAGHDDAAVISQNEFLANALPQYAQLLLALAQKIGTLPPSGAMAGLYTLNDQQSGVWNAPANLSVTSATSLTVDLTDAQQGGLNVPLNGYAINVIRSFPTRGPIVWGARTLNGNSSDWRYIQVRRTVIYIEQSIKNALNQYALAPNNRSTWLAATQMISNFLTSLWQQGGLMGDKASDAFKVQCGLSQTMTADDILNGYMLVQVTLQMIHPGEFIELTFKQTMQGT